MDDNQSRYFGPGASNNFPHRIPVNPQDIPRNIHQPNMNNNMQNMNNNNNNVPSHYTMQMNRMPMPNNMQNIPPRPMQTVNITNPSRGMLNNSMGNMRAQSINTMGGPPTRSNPPPSQMAPGVMRVGGMMNVPQYTNHPSYPNRPPTISNAPNSNQSFESDFPALIQRSEPQGPKSPRNEYKLTQDDFPALGGHYKESISEMPKDLHDGFAQQQQQQHGFLTQSLPTMRTQPGISYEQQQFAAQQQQQQQQQQSQPQQQQKRLTEAKYGLLGLVDIIKMTNQDLNELAPGTDLTTLGLNLNSSSTLYSSFYSPFSDPPDHEIPRSAKQIDVQPAFKKTESFTEETLFYIFYSMPKDIMQLAAAKELYGRNWRYHKTEQVWYSHVPDEPPTNGANNSERGSFFYFDPAKWEKVKKQNYILYLRDLEGAPVLPNFP